MWWFRPFSTFFEFFPEKCRHFGHFGNSPTPWEKSSQNNLYVCAKSSLLSNEPGPVKKYWELRPVEHFEKKNFGKNFFLSFGNYPKTKKGKKILTSKTVRNHSHGHFKPSYGWFEWKMIVRHNVKVKKRENRNRLEPPPLTLYSYD